MSAFARAVDVLFRDRNLSVAAIYTPRAGAPIALRVVQRRGDQIAKGFGVDAVIPAVAADVRRVDVPAVSEGDRLAIGAAEFVVATFGREDPDQLVWTLGLEVAQ